MTNQFTKEWALGIIAQREAERNPEGLLQDPDNPDPGLESDLQRNCTDFLDVRGYPWFHDYSRKKNRPGWSDLFVFMPMRTIVLVELKSESGTFRKEQKELRLVLHHLGHPVYPARSMKRFREIILKEEMLLRKRGWNP